MKEIVKTMKDLDILHNIVEIEKSLKKKGESNLKTIIVITDI